MTWVTTDDVYSEAWRRILEYTNIDLVIMKIESIHGKAINSSIKSNYKKQAEQIRLSILQAQEYFQAANQSSLFTSPNHLYYGMVSLASAIMLLFGDGEKALDRLRQDTKNRHHGLEFSTAITRTSCKSSLSILEQSYAKILKNGHFINWYSTLPNVEIVCAVVKHIFDNGQSSTGRERVGHELLLSHEKIVNRKYSVINLTKRLPDLAQDLLRYGTQVPASRLNYDITFNHDKITNNYNWRIHSAPNPDILEKMLEYFKSPCRYALQWDCTDYEKKNMCAVSFHTTRGDKVIFSYPSIRETLNNDQVGYAFKLDTHEIVDAYLVGYSLSMLSRYYPDYWVACLESHCKAAKVIERLIYILIKKFPVMALKFLDKDEIVISTHRPPWYI